MEQYGLALKENKTQLHYLTETDGFEYLGYAFTARGKTILEKAVVSLTARLETMWLTSKLNLEEKIRKGREIIGGWEQYFREDHEIGSILEYVLVLSMTRNKTPEIVEKIEKQRFSFMNYYRDVASWLIEYWNEKGRAENVLREYEQFFQVPEEDKKDTPEEAALGELLSCDRQFFVQPNEDLYVNIIQQYKLLTAEYGCNCSFRQTKNCYPSPVLHALKNSGDDDTGITLPVSRTVSKAKEETVYEEINIHKQTQKLAQRIVEMKKQKRGLDKSIRKIEVELQKIFDNANIDCLEIEMGLLVRRKKGDGYEWLIEI